ncbi:hypothetical protein NESM_000684000 [Novymonas esmeraldas]|uniref:Uncharacterized protein n=1 Tax=Novymonas esmeraldas TaxID=1808958 RepID=A0AAW0EW87_9TRYP
MLALVALGSCVLLLLVAASSPDGEALARLLAEESAAAMPVHPPYTMFHALKLESREAITASILTAGTSGKQWVPGMPSVARRSGESLLTDRRTVWNAAASDAVKVCFSFHSRPFVRPDGAAVNASAPTTSSLQLWPYYYQLQDVMKAHPTLVTTQVDRGVLDIDTTAFAFLDAVQSQREVEVVVLAYNDWDAYADSALHALAEYAAEMSAALYTPGSPQDAAAEHCPASGKLDPSAVAQVKAAAFSDTAAAAPAAEPAAATPWLATATYATMSFSNSTTGADAAQPPLHLIGATRMAALDGRSVPLAQRFTMLHRSAGPRLYMLTLHSVAQLRTYEPSSVAVPPSMPALHGFTAADVRRFAHQHSRGTFLLPNAAAYKTALALHRRVLLLVGYPAELPAKWWAAIAGTPGTHNAALAEVRQRMPFFLVQSPRPLSDTPAARATQCVLPARRLDLGSALELVYGADTSRTLLNTLRWSNSSLQLRLVQARSSAEDCQWVQTIAVPSPTAQTDIALYDAVMGAALAELVAGLQSGVEGWLPRLTNSADFTLQLNRLLRAEVSNASGQAPPALLLAVEKSPDCGAALQRLRKGLAERTEPARLTGAAAAAYASLAGSATTVHAELEHAAQHVPLSALPTLFDAVPQTQTQAWTALAERCPLYVIVSESTAIYRIDPTAPVAKPSPASLEMVDDGALAVALLEINTALQVAGGTAARAVRSSPHRTSGTGGEWWLSVPEAMEAPVVMYSFATDAHAAGAAATPAEPTFVLLIDADCGVCANYVKAFELLRSCYRRTSGASSAESQRFVLVDLARGLAGSRAAAQPDGAALPHWQRAEALLMPHYITDVAHLKVPQLVAANATHAMATLPTEAYAEHWNWPHAVMQLLSLVDAAVDVDATKSALWAALKAEGARREPFRLGAQAGKST